RGKRIRKRNISQIRLPPFVCHGTSCHIPHYVFGFIMKQNRTVCLNGPARHARSRIDCSTYTPFLAEFRSNSLRATWPLLLILTAAFLFGGCRPKPPEHGTEWVIQAQGTEGQGVDEKLTGQIARNLERRLEGYGLRQFAVRPTTTNSIVIQIPALPEE